MADRAAEHYERVTEAWMQWIMGDDLHFGLFTSENQSLAQATHNLTAQLAQHAGLSSGMRVLDVGCGVGTSAFYLAKEYGCHVTGISTSPVGISIACERSTKLDLSENTRFEVRDATSNELPDASFDRIFSLESAHTMHDKVRMFCECHRVLKPGGTLVLCDVAMVSTPEVEDTFYQMLGHSAAVAAHMKAAVHNTMHRVFGSSILTQHTQYRDAAIAAGFSDVQIIDLSSNVRATLEHWGQNAHINRDRLIERLGQTYVDDFFIALLHMSYGWGQVGGYFLMSATKHEEPLLADASG